MIDIVKAKKEFERYIDYNFSDLHNDNIELKREHCLRVSILSKRIAKEIGMGQEDIELAELIGLLHDIGRFEQLRQYNTFYDAKSIDHAAYGVKILSDNNYLSWFCDDEKFRNIILVAIYNHNKFRIEKNINNERMRTHCKIIRDADKIDIENFMRTKKFTDVYDDNNISTSVIAKKVYDAIMNGEQPNRADFKSDIDHFMNLLTYPYDMYYPESIKILKDSEYSENLADRILEVSKDENAEMIENVREKINKYMDNRIKNNITIEG